MRRTAVGGGAVAEDVNAIIDRKLASSWGRSSSSVSGSTSLNKSCSNNRSIHITNTNHHLELHHLITAAAAASKGSDDVNLSSSYWHCVLERLALHPSEAIVLDGRGRTGLMAVCAASAPLHVVEQVLAATKFGLETSRDKTGYTALLIALFAGAPLSTIECLLRKNGRGQVTRSNHQGNLPLHLILQHEFDDDRRNDLLDLLLSYDSEVVTRQLVYENHRGVTPLHVALENRNRIQTSLIERLVRACPQALTKRACGFTPLVSAIRENAPLSVLRFLIRTNPDVTRIPESDGKYPLRRALENRNYNAEMIKLLCTCPEAVETLDTMGRNCVVVALEQWSFSPILMDVAILQMLLEQAPAAARDMPHHRNTTSTMSRSNAIRRPPCFSTLSPTRVCFNEYGDAVSVLERLQMRRQPLRAQKAILSQWWQITLMVLEAASTQESILLTAMTGGAPLVVLERLLEERPQLTTICNSQGQTPLQVACEAGKADWIRSLVLANPALAAIASQEARYPLFYLAEQHLSALLPPVMKAYPMAVSMVDPAFGLYPFLVAATAATDAAATHNNNNNNNNNVNNNPSHSEVNREAAARQLDTIFQLVLQSPNSIARCSISHDL